MVIPLDNALPRIKTLLNEIFRIALEVEGLERPHAVGIRHFAVQAYQTCATVDGTSDSEKAMVIGISYGLYKQMLARQRGNLPPERILTKEIMDVLGWYHPSMYGASRDLTRRAKQQGFKLQISESDLSKLKNTGRGISVPRLSQIVSLMEPGLQPGNLQVMVRTGDPEEEQPNHTLFRQLLCVLSPPHYSLSWQPFAVLVQPGSGPVKRLWAIPPWGYSNKTMGEWKHIIELARKDLGQGIEVELAANRTPLYYWAPASVPAETGLLVSLLDMGCPLLDTLNCLLVRPANEAGIEFPFRDPFAAEPAQMRRDFLEAVEQLRRSEYDILDVFLAHAAAAAWFNAEHCAQGAEIAETLPYQIGFGGIQSLYLFFYLTNQLSASEEAL